MLLGQSPAIQNLRETIRRVAAIPRPVLLVGERGTGKELAARAIHDHSPRADKPFIAVNCAAFADTLLENELFGHERGAFSGADNRTTGKFDAAAGGTLFLDEIGNMSLAFQQKLLRTVEYGVFLRVGGSSEQSTDARLIAATNVDLRDRIARGSFLADLFDRLSFEVIELPPLRERRDDIALLAQHFLQQFIKEVPAVKARTIDPAVLELLMAYPFPGNIRELKHIIERGAYRDTTQEINPIDVLPLDPGFMSPIADGFEARVAAFKRRLIVEALVASGGNQAAAARQLKLSYHRFRYHHQMAMSLPATSKKRKAARSKKSRTSRSGRSKSSPRR